MRRRNGENHPSPFLILRRPEERKAGLNYSSGLRKTGEQKSWEMLGEDKEEAEQANMLSLESISGPPPLSPGTQGSLSVQEERAQRQLAPGGHRKEKCCC